MTRNCSACNIEIDANNFKKDRIVCKSCYSRNKRKKNDNDTLIQPSKINNVNKNNDNNVSVPAYENHAYVVFGPRYVGKTYHLLKVLEKIINKRSIHIITRSPNQYPN